MELKKKFGKRWIQLLTNSGEQIVEQLPTNDELIRRFVIFGDELEFVIAVVASIGGEPSSRATEARIAADCKYPRPLTS